ncbi:MAG: EAL domain-containing protein [Ruminococcaceae bacterium]|nr:EAL domain-containing protein [Oscillospiraceae bacterium]
MWNYSYELPGFVVLIVLLCHYAAMPRANIRINRTFLTLLNLQLATLLFDVFASRADEAFEIIPAFWLYLLNTGFFVFYLARAFCFFVLTCDILRIKPSVKPHRTALFASVFVISELVALSSFFTGAVFRISEAGYERGPLYPILYVCWGFYLLCSFALIFRRAKVLSRYEFFSALVYNLLLLAGNVVRFLFPRLLIMNTFCMPAILSIYLSFENPDLYLSNRRIAFNMSALREELVDLFEHKRPFRILAFVTQDYIDTRSIYGGAQTDRGVDMIARYLTVNFPFCRVFYLRNGCFALLGPRSMFWEEVREAIVERFQNSWEADDAELYLSVAFVQVGPDAGIDDADKVVNNLVSALGRASQAVDSTINLDTVRELDKESEVKRALEQALEQDQLEIYLQPLFDSKTREPVGAEVLARIRDADGRIVSPNLFIPIAERNGKINQLGEQVLEKACRFIRDNDLAAMGLSWLNVNLSPIQCMKRDLSERFLAILERNGVAPELIRLEITEQAVVDIPLLEKHIETLHKNGFHFALDDYGSGFSNLSRVKHYPFVSIKLDTEVVWDYFHEQDQLLPGIVQAFKQMGYNVTAEGIETEEMAASMAAIGCDYLQGFLFSKPLPIPEFVEKYCRDN